MGDDIRPQNTAAKSSTSAPIDYPILCANFTETFYDIVYDMDSTALVESHGPLRMQSPEKCTLTEVQDETAAMYFLEKRSVQQELPKGQNEKDICVTDTSCDVTNSRCNYYDIAVYAFTFVLMTFVSYYVIYMSLTRTFQFGAAHPACMTIATMLCTPCAVMLVSYNNPLQRIFNLQKRIQLHFILHISSLTLMIIGICAMYGAKEREHRSHIVTAHETIGASTLSLYIVTMSVGYILHSSLYIQLNISLPHLKTVHNLFGLLTVFFHLITVVNGIYNHNFVYVLGHKGQFLCLVSVAGIYLTSYMPAIRSAYYRLRFS